MFIAFDDEPKAKDPSLTAADRETEQGQEAKAADQYAIYVDDRDRVWAVPDFSFPSARTKYIRATDYEFLRVAAEAAAERLQDNERWWHQARTSNTPTRFEKQSYEARAQVTRKTLAQLQSALSPQDNKESKSNG